MINKFSISILSSFLLCCIAFPLNTFGQYKVGFSQCSTDHNWRKSQNRQMQIEAALYPDLELIIKDAQNNSNKQIEQINNFLNDGIDLLIVSAEDSKALTPIVEKVMSTGIPVILLERQINSQTFTTFIGCNNYDIGQGAAEYASKLLGGRGQIIEITGMIESSSATERQNGFRDELAKYPGISIKQTINGEWLYSRAYAKVSEIIKSGESFDLIFAHNDLMALGALQAIENLNIKNRPYLIGVDGLSGDQGGLDAVLNKDIDATFLYPTGGDLAIQVANKILLGQPFKHEYTLETIVIDSTNAKILSLLTNHIESFQQNLEVQSSNLDFQLSKKQSQYVLLILTTICLSLVLLLIFVAYRNFRSKVKANLKLVEINDKIENQNKEITKRNDELIRFGNELEQTLNVKLSFFTIVSHEFKTPLTLIKGPLENLMEKKIFRGNKEHFLFKLIYKNTLNLLQLINQLMDFRKLERKKLELFPSKTRVVKLINVIIKSFSSLLKQRNIEISFQFGDEDLELFLDVEKIQKSIISIVSFIVEHSDDGGKIFIKINEFYDSINWSKEDKIIIEIVLGSIVLPEEDLDTLFVAFKESTKYSNSFKTMFGLNLAKEYVEMHGGQILVKSSESTGISFNIYLPILDESGLILFDELDNTQTTEFSGLSQKDFEFLEIQETAKPMDQKSLTSNLPLILVVEDNADIREYIKMSLVDKYIVSEAENGIEAIKSININEPDLIISDVVMPVMDGLELTRKLKADIKTCHIPIILLTAWGELEHKLEGLDVGADAYLQKPFNSRHLQVSIHNQLNLRNDLFNHYRLASQEFFENDKEGLNKIDKKFLNEIVRIIDSSAQKDTFSVNDLSERLNMSRTFLYRKIKKITNMSVSEFIVSIKLKSSLELLKSSGKTISEIAYEVGFKTPSYFTRCFKSLYNITPTEYVERNRTYGK